MKYGHTPILPWSPNCNHDDDDVFLTNTDIFKGKRVIYTEKLDGENTSCFRNKIHARSEDGYGRAWQSYMQKYYAAFSSDIPEGMQICGECVYATHSITYQTLPTCYFVFAIFVDGMSLSWNDVVMWSDLLGLDTVPVVPDMPPFLHEVPIPSKSAFGDTCEGYVVRNIEAYPVFEMEQNMGKAVRSHHVKTDVHWTKTWKKAQFTEDPIERLFRKRG
jgi:hypothetical protein